jgi:hypothetical protein
MVDPRNEKHHRDVNFIVGPGFPAWPNQQRVLRPGWKAWPHNEYQLGEMIPSRQIRWLFSILQYTFASEQNTSANPAIV